MSIQLQTAGPPVAHGAFESDIPARLDRLPWSRFHWLLVSALGITWVLDGLEGTVVGAVIPLLQRHDTLNLSDRQIGFAGSLYIMGLILGALVFGYLTDQMGRKKLFSVTLGIYLVGATLTAFAWDFWSLLLFRFITGMAIGGEYSAINSAIDELIPARLRGRVDLAINSTFWIGAILGALVTLVLVNTLSDDMAWRCAFGLGGLVGGAMILARRYVPESPRWLISHGRQEEAETIMRKIEADASARQPLAPVTHRIKVQPSTGINFRHVAHTLFVRYRSRAMVGLVLIAAQALFYNGVSFTFPLMLSDMFKVSEKEIPTFVLCMALANLLGPLLLGRLFDTVGRRVMISATYALAGLGILATEALVFRQGILTADQDVGLLQGIGSGLSLLFTTGQLNAQTHTLLWGISFFFASAAASAGYLTVSEIFPVEMRGLAIALFFALGTAVAAASPELFSVLLHTHQPHWIFLGYLVSALVMIVAAVVQWCFGLDTEQKSLEDVASPMTSE